MPSGRTTVVETPSASRLCSVSTPTPPDMRPENTPERVETGSSEWPSHVHSWISVGSPLALNSTLS